MQKVGLASYRATAAIALTWLRVVMLVSGGWLSFDPLRRVTPLTGLSSLYVNRAY